MQFKDIPAIPTKFMKKFKTHVKKNQKIEKISLVTFTRAVLRILFPK